MIDIVEKLKRIADAAGYTDGTDTPLGEQVREGATEIERLRVEVRHLRIDNARLRDEAAISSTERVTTENKG